MQDRAYSLADRLLMQFDQGLRTVFGQPQTTGRPDPAGSAEEAALTDEERSRSMRLMRVNHTGEICAQALYQGQALTARSERVREAMKEAAAEENDHLDWCQRRVEALGGRTSRLNPLFYLGSLGVGALAGAIGDRWSLGFLAETERQVVRHLDGHLQRMPAGDAVSRAIAEQMREDEGRHATTAVEHGAAELPEPVKRFMGLSSKVMTTTTYWV
ncbi:2-polyprenyl-3-methyl-6-methoxy-1,4-benzoquinone monooxygenase [Ectothiorhodospiraceae bacterium WFHF3C12]|nr:2-polyprenyl-3-methyl-6-methoxy-1,4-benzoquinone monooxygenase [Ectothiorhodospiraceae bacterium WFHF3C12]